MNLPNHRDCLLSVFARISARYRWLHGPVTLLVMLLQRTPVVRVAGQIEYVTETGAGSLLRSVFALGALGGFHSLAGATGTVVTTTTGGGTTTTTTSPMNFTVTNATPTSGPDGTTFTVNSNLGLALNVDITLAGGVSNPKSWIVTGGLPDGLSVVGGNPLNVGVPYKLTIAGTPTTTGTWSVTVTAYAGLNETGSSSSLTCNFTVVDTATSAPAILTQPASTTALLGGSVAFTATASGNPTPVYSWYHGATLLAGQTTTTLTLNNLQSSDAGNYTFVASSPAGTATSSPVTLTFVTTAVAPAITRPPQSLVVNQGASATFSVVASGTGILTYQWEQNGSVLTGATTSSYTIPTVSPTRAGNYSVTVTNSAGSATSASATLTVIPLLTAPTIVAQPQAAAITTGSSVIFSVLAGGLSPFTYQWSKQGVPIAGATAKNYSIPLVQASDAADYTVTVSNIYGSTVSNPATLTVVAATDAPVISRQPQSLATAPGGSAAFSVVAIGSAPLAYQWMLNGTAIAGATDASYVDSNVQLGDAGNYTVVVTNAVGSVTSQAATLTVSSSATAAAPVFSTQPMSDTAAAGHSVTFSAATSGNPPSSYQWQVSTNGGASWTSLSDDSTYSGSNTSTLTVSSVSGAMSGYHYRLVASNAAGSAITSSLTLTVAAPPFPAPYGITVDSSGNLFVSDNSTNTVQFVTPGGVVSLLAGASGQQGSADGTYGSALFRQPRAVTLDTAENLYVADTGNSLIRKISPAGVVTTLAGSSTTQGYNDGAGTSAVFNSPQALVVDTSGNVYVADTANSAIRKISPAGSVVTLAGNGAKGSADGANTQARFNQPAGITIDSSGNLYVADTVNDTIRKVTPTGVVTTLAGLAGVGGYEDGTGAAALFNQPTGLAIDSSGNLYVADTGNEVIRVVKPNGTVSTLAGLPSVAGLLDGNGYNAWFNQPENLSLDAAGNLYVTDNGNAAIRKVTPAGDVTTLVLSSTTATPSVPAPPAGSTTGTGTTTGSGTTSGTSGSSGSSSGGGAFDPGFVAALLGLFALSRRRRFRPALGR